MSDLEPLQLERDNRFQLLYSSLQSFEESKDFYRPKILSEKELLLSSINDSEDTRALILLSNMLQVKDEKIKEFALSITTQNVHLLISRLNSDEKTCADSLRLLGDLVEVDKGQLGKLALGKIKEKLPTLLDEVEDTERRSTILDHAIAYGDESTVTEAKDIIRDTIKNLGNVQRGEADFVNGELVQDNLFYRLISPKKNETFIEVTRAMGEHLESYGLDGYELLGIWRTNCEPWASDLVILLNLATINELEKANPGSSSRLVSENHIVNFGRYPIELLTLQEEKKDEKSVMRIVSTVSDRQGAFYDPHTFAFYEKLTKDFSESMQIQVFEVSPELPELPAKAVESDFSILQIHGHPKKMQIGYDQKDRPLFFDAKDFERDPALLGLSTIRKGTRLISASCSTGFVEEVPNPDDLGIGQAISGYFGIKVCAPISPAGIKEIEISEVSTGESVLIPDFVAGKSFEGEPVKTSYFDSGKIISKDEYKAGRGDVPPRSASEDFNDMVKKFVEERRGRVRIEPFEWVVRNVKKDKEWEQLAYVTDVKVISPPDTPDLTQLQVQFINQYGISSGFVFDASKPYLSEAPNGFSVGDVIKINLKGLNYKSIRPLKLNLNEKEEVIAGFKSLEELK